MQALRGRGPAAGRRAGGRDDEAAARGLEARRGRQGHPAPAQVPGLLAHHELRQRARAHFEEALRYAQKADTTGLLAQALAGLGLLSKSMGQTTLAHGYLEEARAIADGLGAEKLVGRIDAVL